MATSASSDTGPDGAAGGPSGPRALHGLEASERQLAKFVSAGLSDAEIAGRLALDVGAVQLKLDALLGKLHLRSRTELALLAADGPPDESTWPARAR